MRHEDGPGLVRDLVEGSIHLGRSYDEHWGPWGCVRRGARFDDSSSGSGIRSKVSARVNPRVVGGVDVILGTGVGPNSCSGRRKKGREADRTAFDIGNGLGASLRTFGRWVGTRTDANVYRGHG